MTDAPYVQQEPIPAVIASAPEKLASGFQFSEGPVWCPEGYVVFSDIPGNRNYKWSEEGGLETFRDPSGHANGLTLDLEGRLIICKQEIHAIVRLEEDGSETILADKFEGKRFNSPNDVVLRSDGTIYFSDPPYFVKPEEREIDEQAFYAIKPSGEVIKVATGYNKPNGLAFSPDEKVLYVNDTGERIIDAYDVNADGTLSNKRRFASLESEIKQGNPDGMKVDVEGNLYCTGPGAVWIHDKNGKLLGRLVLPELAANMAFGDADHKSLYFTARTSLYRVRVNVEGIGAAWAFKK